MSRPNIAKRIAASKLTVPSDYDPEDWDDDADGPTVRKVPELLTVMDDGYVLITPNDSEVWDKAVHCLIHDTIRYLERHKTSGSKTDGSTNKFVNRHVAINMTYVNRISSGFFGLLHDWFDKGFRIRLIQPTEHVRQFYWLSQFCKPISGSGGGSSGNGRDYQFCDSDKGGDDVLPIRWNGLIDD